MQSIDCPWDASEAETKEFLESSLAWGQSVSRPIDIKKLDSNIIQSIGTIGGGNHFAEF